MMRRIGTSALAVMAAVVFLAACDSGGGTEPSTAARIVAAVTVGGTGLSGVTVELYAGGGASALDDAVTGAGGEVEFGGLDAGTYDVAVTVPAGYVVADGGVDRKPVMVAAGEEGSVSFALEEDAGATIVEVHLTSNLRFSPADLTIRPGTTVRWVNDANLFHTITPDGHTEWEEASLAAAGQTFTHTFETEGTYPYYCSPHRGQGMTGTVTVQAQAAR